MDAVSLRYRFAPRGVARANGTAARLLLAFASPQHTMIG